MGTGSQQGQSREDKRDHLVTTSRFLQLIRPSTEGENISRGSAGRLCHAIAQLEQLGEETFSWREGDLLTSA